MFENLGRSARAHGGAGAALGRHGARGGALAALLLLFSGPVFADPVCSADALYLRTPTGHEMRFSTEVADDPGERAKGLMNRETLAKSASMLFVYEAPKAASFWMKNTLIPLDMLFLDETGQVQHIHPMAVPLDETGIDGGDDVKFVIEINGGLAKLLGIEPGAVLLHPAVDPSLAKWPCDVH